MSREQPTHEIIRGYIAHRDSIRPTMQNTRRKQRELSMIVDKALADMGSSLETVNLDDLYKLAAYGNKYSTNMRQCYIGNLKTLAKYINEWHHEISGIQRFLSEVKAGNPVASARKEALTMDEWNTVINAPMSARDRAIIAIMYGGCHRPGEVLILKWSDLKNTTQGIEYQIRFKTRKTRTIVMKARTWNILKAWMRECGAMVGSDALIFPDPRGDQYQTLHIIKDLFNDLRKKTGIGKLKPSVIRITAITHDVDAGKSIQYICMRAWGEPYNDMINIYARPDSARIQREQHEKDGDKVSVMSQPAPYSIDDEDRMKEMEMKIAAMEVMLNRMKK
jgi:integrase